MCGNLINNLLAILIKYRITVFIRTRYFFNYYARICIIAQSNPVSTRLSLITNGCTMVFRAAQKPDRNTVSFTRTLIPNTDSL